MIASNANASIKELKQATNNLAAFARCNQGNCALHTCSLRLKKNQLFPSSFPLIRLLGNYLLCLLSKAANNKRHLEQKKVINALLSSLKTIRKHHLFVQQLRLGGKEQKAFACEVLNSVATYNTLVEKQASHTGINKLLHCLHEGAHYSLKEEKTLVPLADFFSTLQKSPGQGTNAPSQKIKSLPKTNKLSPQERDAFTMKVISLLKKQGISSKEITKKLQKEKIHTIVKHTLDPLSKQPVAIISIEQQLQFSKKGTLYKLSGKFKRLSEEEGASVPIPNSFRCQSDED